VPNLVTGGTGFVGAHVVRALLARGREVRCLVRPGSPRDNLAGLPVEIVPGDLNEPASLSRACAGADIVYHVAADYRLYARDPRNIGVRCLAVVRPLVDIRGMDLDRDADPLEQLAPARRCRRQ